MSMVSSKPRTVLIPLAVTRLSTALEVPVDVPCLVCGEPLSIHQPDPDAPERLLGTCDACDSWHLIDASTGVMALLPDAAGLRAARHAPQASNAPVTSILAPWFWQERA